MILLIDNYDSFVYNLARYFERLGQGVEVVRNDRVDAEGVRRMCPDAVVLSPGPGTPEEAGCSMEIVRKLHREVPLLGVCLGHQAIAAALGATVHRSGAPMHGRSSAVRHEGQGIFAGLPDGFSVGRYHSLIVDPETLPPELVPTAWADDGTLLAFQHRHLPLVGLQFHPESILTRHGYRLLAGFLKLAGIPARGDVDSLQREEDQTPPPVAHPTPGGPIAF